MPWEPQFTRTSDLRSGRQSAHHLGVAPVWARVPHNSPSRIPVPAGLRAHAVSSRQNVTSNHRASDTVVCEGRPQVLNGRFMYGPLDVVTLTGEKVRTRRPWPRVHPPPSS